MRKSDIVRKLEAGVCMVSFLTVNTNRVRVMKCTRNSNVVPAYVGEFEPVERGAKTVIVWDIDKEDYRSFRVENVHSVVAV